MAFGLVEAVVYKTADDTRESQWTHDNRVANDGDVDDACGGHRLVEDNVVQKRLEGDSSERRTGRVWVDRGNARGRCGVCWTWNVAEYPARELKYAWSHTT